MPTGTSRLLVLLIRSCELGAVIILGAVAEDPQQRREVGVHLEVRGQIVNRNDCLDRGEICLDVGTVEVLAPLDMQPDRSEVNVSPTPQPTGARPAAPTPARALARSRERRESRLLDMRVQ